ncbi:MAG: cytochrome P450, partial [Acidobacteria bacterium]|nr:cytochrome P450 [Acidobacteriota bacterium]
REMSELTFDIVGETLFGRDIKEHAREMARILDVVNLSSNDLRSVLTLHPWIPTPYNRKWKRAMKRLDGIVFGLMGERGPHGDGSGNLLGRLFAARDEETGEGMDDRQIRDEVVTLILAGHETSAMALSWTLYLLATRPDIEERLVEHLGANLHGAPATTEDLPRLPYLKQVVQESMRIYPPVWGYVRRAERETQLGDYVLPAKTWVGVVTWALHRHPEFWPDPERFDPDRFAPERAEERNFFAYLPFAAGPRTCIGAGMAMLETQLILAQIVPRFRMRVVPGHPIESQAVVTLKPRHGIPVTLTRR